MNDEMKKEVCAICLWGDGKWRGREGHSLNRFLPVCKFCADDGWTADPKEIQDAILADPVLSKHVNHESQF